MCAKQYAKGCTYTVSSNFPTPLGMYYNYAYPQREAPRSDTTSQLAHTWLKWQSQALDSGLPDSKA